MLAQASDIVNRYTPILFAAPIVTIQKLLRSYSKKTTEIHTPITGIKSAKWTSTFDNTAQIYKAYSRYTAMRSLGTFRSQAGAKRFAILRTIIDSAIKQGIHPFQALKMPHIIINRPE